GSMSLGVTTMPLLLKTDAGQVLMPFTDKPFNPGAGGLLAALMMGIVVAYLERAIDKVIPSMLKTFLTPLLTLIIGAFLSVLIIQPAGAALTQGIYTVLNFVYEQLGIFGGYILAAGFLPIVSVGLHQALTPIHVLLNNPEGPTQGINYLLPILMMAGGGQVGAGLALYLKTKN
ncbi:MAG: PTS transporter subunit EIIC, partial [Solobacterium sp.]|nr:PTS transporter subunit EIIC [Solobacterium sp.]